MFKNISLLRESNAFPMLLLGFTVENNKQNLLKAIKVNGIAYLIEVKQIFSLFFLLLRNKKVME